MARVRRGEHVVAVTWQGLPAPAAWQQVGRYGVAGQPTGQPTSLYTQVQRRNGVASISSHRDSLEYGRAWQATAQPTSTYTQVQRSVMKPHGPQLSRLTVAQMQGNIRAAAVRQSGAGVVSFANSLLASGRNG